MELPTEEFAKYGILGMGWFLFIWQYAQNKSLTDKFVDLAIKVGVSYESMKAVIEKLGKT